MKHVQVHFGALHKKEEDKSLPSHPPISTLGVEEEYQVIDPVTRSLSNDASSIFTYLQSSSSIDVQTELQRSQIEICTPVCQSLSDVRTELTRARAIIIEAADHFDRKIAAAGTHPFSPWHEQKTSDTPRYLAMQDKYRQIVREQVIFGYHVHVSYDNRDVAIQAVNRARLWLAPLLALTANSPFWSGEDTGYSSFRSTIWSRWPLAGPPAFFSSTQEYDHLVNSLVNSQSIADTSHLYWDIRLSGRYPTVEFRIMDVCMTIDEAVMVAGLVRALMQTCERQVIEGQPCPTVPIELLRVAQWRAARYGLQSELLDIDTEQMIPARELLERLLIMIRPALEASDDWDEVSALLHQTLLHGNGADRQRAVFQRTGKLEDVVDFIVESTAHGNVRV